MSPERFQRIEELYHAAKDARGADRAALLAQTDPDLRRAVESLLAERSSDDFLARPLGNLLEDATATDIASGLQFGPYRIESKLGEGGMGEVFRAIDTRLGRAVALKTTRSHFTGRFEREARAISSLNHPNICTLHDVGPNYLVMELVEGESLSDLLKRGPLPVQTAMVYAAQIAAALVEAHAKGVIHRDLKPGNIMLGKSGVKVLDFGLARVCGDETLTASHMIVGTPAYMAPEQREGKTADIRSDIYAFGCVLYEMLTGVRVGAGPLKRIAPRKLELLLKRCLEANPDSRWQSSAELQSALAAVRLGKRWLYIGAAAAILVVGAAAGAWALNRQPKLTAKDTVVVGEFENKTGDPVFDQTLRQGLTAQLQQSPFLTLVSDQQIQQELRLMNRPPGTKLTLDVSREVCERAGGAAVLDGSITGLGNQYVLWLRARNCRTGDVLAEEQAQPERKEDVLKALGSIAVQMRARLGESLASVQEHSAPLPDATTSSLEALKAYSFANSAIHAGDVRAAISHLQQAVAIDPEFAMAHADLGFMSWNIGQTDLGAEEVRIAHQYLDRVSDREKRYIQMLYDREVTGNLQKEFQTLEAWAQTYPRDSYAPGILSGWVAFGTGQYERGVQAAKKSIELDQSISAPYSGLALHYMYLNRFKESADALKLGAERHFETADFLMNRYYLAFLTGDTAGMQREIDRAPIVQAEEWMAHHQALVLAHSGRMRDARNMWDRAIALARQAGAPERVAIYTAAEAVCEAHVGNTVPAKSGARAAAELAKGRDVTYAAAFALADAGELSEAQKLAADLAKRFPEDTPVQFEYLPTLRALSALARRTPAQAIEALQPAIPYDAALPGTAFYAKFGGLYTAYVRGQAYLAAGQGEAAAAEFQKVLAHPGIVLADPVGALARLQLARAYVLARDVAKAKDTYRDFLDLWKNADANLPILTQAKAEYARL